MKYGVLPNTGATGKLVSTEIYNEAYEKKSQVHTAVINVTLRVFI